MITFLKLEAFCSLAETLSFTSTAQNLFLSQQTVSRLISELEEELGFRLFNRTSHTVTLTKAGKRYHSTVVEMLWLHENTISELGKNNSGKDGLLIDVQMHLEIGYGATEAMKRTIDSHPSFYKESNRISPNFLKDRLLSGRCDVAFILERFFIADERIRSIPLYETEYLLTVSQRARFSNIPEALDRLKYEKLYYNALEAESPSSCAIRCQREQFYLNLSPSETIWKPNAESAYAMVALGEGGYVISTAADHVGLSADRKLMGIPTGKSCKVLAIYRSDEERPIVSDYISNLSDVYKKLYPKFNPSEIIYY